MHKVRCPHITMLPPSACRSWHHASNKCGLSFKLKLPLCSLACIWFLYSVTSVVCTFHIMQQRRSNSARTLQSKPWRKKWSKTVTLPESAWLWFCSFGCVAGTYPGACHPLHFSKCIYMTSTLVRQASPAVKAEAPPRLTMIMMAIT